MTDQELEKFKKLIINGQFTNDSYKRLMHKFDFDIIKDFNMEEEYTKVIKKESNLRARQRAVIGDMLQLRDMLKDHADGKLVDSTETTKSEEHVCTCGDNGCKCTNETCTCDKKE